MSIQMSYIVKLVRLPIESGMELSWFSLRSSLSMRAMRMVINEISNVLHSQVGQLAYAVRKGGKLVIAEVKPIIEW